MKIRTLATFATLAAGVMFSLGCSGRGEERTSDSYGRRTGQASGERSDQDRAFMATAAESNLAEIEAGGMVEKNTTNPDVQQFGRVMVKDHRQANEALADLAGKKGVRLPTRPDDAHREELARLGGLKGADFDRSFAAMMAGDHAKAVSLFEENARQAKDPDVRTFAEELLPVLREHLNMAQILNSKVGAGPAVR